MLIRRQDCCRPISVGLEPKNYTKVVFSRAKKHPSIHQRFVNKVRCWWWSSEAWSTSVVETPFVSVVVWNWSVQVKLWNVDTKECAMAFKGHNAEASSS